LPFWSKLEPQRTIINPLSTRNSSPVPSKLAAQEIQLSFFGAAKPIESADFPFIRPASSPFSF
jgi:hypothetical protein